MKSDRTSTGDEITPEYIAELAEEAEAGFAGRKGRWVPLPGRPPLSEAGPSRRLQTRITPELGKSLDAMAIERETTVSAIVREALEQFLRDAA